MMSPRIVFLLGTLIAFAGTGEAAVSTCTGAANTIYNTENNPGGTGANACKCVDGYVSIGGSNTIILGDVALTCTKCAPGYYLSAGSSTATAVCTQAPANKWHAGLNDLTSGFTAEVANSCPTNTESVAGSSALSDCKVKAGYYIKKFDFDSTSYGTNKLITITGSGHDLDNGDTVLYYDGGQADLTAASAAVTDGTMFYVVEKTTTTFAIASSSAGTALTLGAGHASNYFTSIVQVPVNSYGAGGAAASGNADTITACPYAGTTAAVGKAALSDCRPNCGTADAAEGTVDATLKTKVQGGTCVCAETHYGQPVDAALSTAAAPTQGCTGAPTLTIATGKILNSGNTIELPAGHSVRIGDLFTFSGGANSGITASKRYMAMSLSAGKITVRILDAATDPASGNVVTTSGNSNAAATLAPAGHAFTITCTHATNLFTTSYDHGLSTGDKLLYKRGSGTIPGGLTADDASSYYVVRLSSTTFSLSDKPGGTAKAISSTPADIAKQYVEYHGVKGFTIPTTGIVLATDTITFAAHGLSNGDQVIYNNGAGDAAAGLTTGVRYFVRDVTTNTFKVSATPGGSAVDITGAGNDAQFFDTVAVPRSTFNVFATGGPCPTGNHLVGTEAGSSVATLATDGDGVTALGNCAVKAGYYIKAKSGSYGATTSLDIEPALLNKYAAGGLSVDQQATATNAGLTACPFAGTTGRAAVHTAAVANGIFTSAGHGLSDGDQVSYQSGTGAVATDADGNLVDGDHYYVRDKTDNTFKIAKTSGGTALVLAGGTITQYFTPVGKSLVTQCTPGASTAAIPGSSISSNTVTLTAHGLSNGDQVQYQSASATALDAGGALSDGDILHVTEKTDTTFKLALPAAPGTAVALSAGNDAQYLVVPSAGDCGASSVNAEKNAGTCRCKANFYYTNGASVTGGNSVATGGCTACLFGGTSAAGSTAITDCTPAAAAASSVNSIVTVGGTLNCAPNYFGTPTSLVTVATTAVNTGTNVITVTAHGFADGDQVVYNQVSSGTLMAPLTDGTTYYVRDATANTFKLASSSGGTALVITVAGHSAQTFTPANAKATGGCTACPANSVSVAGTGTDISDCKVSAGYYLSAAKAGSATYGTITQVAANKYAAGGKAVDGAADTGNAAGAACPFGGTSLAGSSVIEDCVPDCGASTVNAVNARGTCICAPNYYGSPLSASGATTAVATKGCTACPTNSEAVAGSAALSACTVKAGYYIATKATSADDATGIVISAIPANFYGTGGTQATHQTANTITATKLACPFAGTSAAGSDAQADCTPNCGTEATLLTRKDGGTCVCQSHVYGTPQDTNSATLLVATKGCRTAVESSAITSITTATPGVVTLSTHGYYTGQKILYTVVGSSPTLLATTGYTIAANTPLWVIRTGAGTFNLASSKANALAGTALTVTNAGHSNKFTAETNTCPAYTQTAYSASNAGAGSLADCEVVAGFYISTGTAQVDNAVGAMAASQVAANSYAPGGYDANIAAESTTSSVCPYAGTTIRAGGKLSDCTPSCGSGTNTVDAGGTCRCASTHYGIPVDAEGLTTGVVTQGCTACPANSETAYTAAAAPTGAIADCKVKAGYYISAFSTTSPYGTIIQTPAGQYLDGSSAANKNSNDSPATCVAKSTSPAGSDTKSDCVTDAGFYLSVASPSATDEGRIAKSEANKYSAGGTSISLTTAETPTACTYGGTSAIGSDAAADCTPSCGTVADVSSGTCVCKAGRTGTPTPTTGAVTGGCTATTCAANQKVTSNACAACGAGTNNAAGDDASGADTTCDAITCTADHYVSSNVCTDCAAGSTNAAGDDATGADTTCDIVSGASPLEVKLTSMIGFLVLGFLALAM